MRYVYSTQSLTTFQQIGDSLEFNLPLFGNNTPCVLKGNLINQGGALTSEGTYQCTFTTEKAEGYFKIKGLQVDHFGLLAATVYTSPTQDFNQTEVRQLFGTCFRIAGAVTIGIAGSGDRCDAKKLGVPALLLP